MNNTSIVDRSYGEDGCTDVEVFVAEDYQNEKPESWFSIGVFVSEQHANDYLEKEGFNDPDRVNEAMSREKVDSFNSQYIAYCD